jgi:hypothetical protein
MLALFTNISHSFIQSLLIPGDREKKHGIYTIMNTRWDIHLIYTVYMYANYRKQWHTSKWWPKTLNDLGKNAYGTEYLY